ncbi:hypothetical protein [Paenibacillus sp. CMAA1364]
MIYIALVLGIILLIVSGVIAKKNSQIIATKNEHHGPSPSAVQYIIHFAEHEEVMELSTLIALFHTSSMEKEKTSHAYLCRVVDERGELTLTEAEQVMLHNIRHAKQKETLLSGLARMDLTLNEDEKLALIRLERECAKDGYEENCS